MNTPHTPLPWYCGEWVDKRATYPDAVLRAVGAKNVRDGALVISEISANP